jgi:hypothetical protein
MEDLIELAHSEGLTGRDATLCDVAQRSLRMTQTDPAHANAWILTGDAWTAADGTETLVVQLDLAAVAAHQFRLPTRGWMVLLVESVRPPEHSAPRTARGVVLDSRAEMGTSLLPVGLDAELVMPRLWHDAVQRLEFDEGEGEAYVTRRRSTRAG